MSGSAQNTSAGVMGFALHLALIISDPFKPFSGISETTPQAGSCLHLFQVHTSPRTMFSTDTLILNGKIGLEA
jgi:hypothetical protein